MPESMPESSEYKNYKEWKQWGRTVSFQPWQARYFSAEISSAKLPNLRTVLEVGFGNGEFLYWAKEQGVAPVGLEIIPELVETASKASFEVYHWNLVEDSEEQSPIQNQTFDCIVAFDVLEHLSIEQAKVALSRMSKLLNQGGKIILRFPNGVSPFYLPLQNGDYTHRMDVTEVKLKHLCIGTGLQLESYRNSARIANKRSTAMLKWFSFKTRDLMEIFIGYLYYNKRIPLDPAATAILKHKI